MRVLTKTPECAIRGVAMIVVEPVPVHRTAVLTRGNFRHGDDAVIPHWTAPGFPEGDLLESSGSPRKLVLAKAGTGGHRLAALDEGTHLLRRPDPFGP